MDMTSLVAAQMRPENRLQYREPAPRATEIRARVLPFLSAFLSHALAELRSQVANDRMRQRDLLRHIPAE